MKPAAALLIVVALMMLAQRGQATGNAYSMESGTSDATGVLTGRVTKGPLAPVQRPGTSAESGVAGVRIDVATLGGKPVTSVETDSTGTFRVELTAGRYKVTMPSLYGAMFSKDLPAIATVRAGEEKRFDIHLDTGIR